MADKYLQNMRAFNDKLQPEKEYWLAKLSGVTEITGFPVDFHHAAGETRPVSSDFALPDFLSQRLISISNQSAAGVFLLLFSGVNYLLYRYTGNEELIIGMPVIKQKNQTLSPGNNLLPLRSRVSGLISFRELLTEIKQTVNDAVKNQNYPFNKIVELLNWQNMNSNVQDGANGSILPVVVALENLHGRNAIDDSTASRYAMVFQFKMEEHTISCSLEYDTNRYAPFTVTRIWSHLVNTLNMVAQNPQAQLKDIEILSTEEKQQIQYEFNRTKVNYPEGKSIHQLFEEQVAKTPESPALITGERQITYRELNERANRLAGFLRCKGVKPDTIVAIMTKRSAEMLTGIFGILKAGGAYLPIDPEYPDERIHYFLEDSGTSLLLTQGPLTSKLRFQGEVACLEDEGIYHGTGTHIGNPEKLNQTGHLAYIIYTSGSTGRPKGVMIEHQSAVNILLALQQKYPLAEADAYLFKTSYTFDVSVAELFGWFHAGGRLVILEPGAEKEPRRILEAIDLYRVTHINFVPSMLKVFLESLSEDDLPALNRLQYVFVAGEALPKELVAKFYKLTNRVRFENIYGPTEGTIYTTGFALDNLPETVNVPIGKPLPNIGVYIVDQNNHLQPAGMPGELCISGAGLARGYLNQPELTSAKFIPNPFYSEQFREFRVKSEGFRVENENLNEFRVKSEEFRVKNHSTDEGLQLSTLNSKLLTDGDSQLSTDKMYRSGDLVKWLPDGNIEFLGRIDHQVKIRGFRIELGEIENRLLQHEKIREAVVVAYDESGGGKYLCAYIVQTLHATSVQDLRAHLANILPDYMIPSYFITLDKFPLTSSGKVDRKALPAPGGLIARARDTGVEYVPPANELEVGLVSIWQEVLGIEKIGVNDNFFLLGGHSLKATTIIQRIRAELKVDLSISVFFKTPTIAGLAKLMVPDEENICPPIPIIPKSDSYPLSSVQRRLFIMSRFEASDIVYNVPVITRIHGKLDRDKLEEAFRLLAARHETLRTSFVMVSGEQAQKVLPEVTLRIDYREAAKDQIEDLITQFVRPFDLSEAPLFRVMLVKQTDAEDSYVLVYDMHHIICDGTSLEIIKRDLIYLYTGKELPELAIQYKDFTAWQNQFFISKSCQKQAHYWHDYFGDEVQRLNMPSDFPRPPVQSFAGDHLDFTIEPELTANIRKLAAGTGTTLYMILLSAFHILIAKYTGQEDIITGSPVAGRQHPDLRNMVGMFVNTVVIKSSQSGVRTYREFLDTVKENSLKVYENQDFPFEKLVEQLENGRDTSRNPVFDLMFVLQNIESAQVEFDGLQTITRELKMNIAKFDLTLEVTEEAEQLCMNIEYCTKLFRADTITGIGRHYQNILRLITDDPEVKPAEIDILSVEEKQRILTGFNRTKAEYPRDQTIPELFEEQAARTPDRVAVVYKERQITYRELDRKANQLAKVLREKGVKNDSPVGIMVERSPFMVIGTLGILKAGGAYLPINPDYPRERIKFMLDDSQAEILLTQEHLAQKVNTGIEIIDLEAEEPYKNDNSNLEKVNQPNDLAYIIYTSGSTGIPKGVMVEHRNVIRLVKNPNYIEFRETDRILQTGAAVFDATTFELWGSLLNGGALYLVDDKVIIDAGKLGAALKEFQICTLWLTAPLFNQLAEETGDIFSGLKYLLVGGDVLSPRHINKVKRLNKDLKVINGYGPTENTTFSTCFLIENEYEDCIPIGKPISNSTAYILGNNGQPQPIGVYGELCAGGDGVARGYLNRPELTAEKFVPNPFWNSTEMEVCGTDLESFQTSNFKLQTSRLYRTGDLTRWLPDGNIEFLGRIDHQVKIRGFRIELGEIENRILKHGQIREAVVVTLTRDEASAKYLCAYIVTNKELTVAELREYIGQELPDYMIPSHFVTLPRMPLNSNGKIDRKALPAPEGILGAGTTYAPPTNEVEAKLAQIWQDVMGIGKIGIDENFFELGGHSLQAMRLVMEIQKKFSVEIPISNIFLAPTVKGLAAILNLPERKIYPQVNITRAQVAASSFYPVSSSQERMFITNQFSPEDIYYNSNASFKIQGHLDRARLETAFKILIGRHESLRTSFELMNNEVVQKVHQQVDFQLDFLEAAEDDAEPLIRRFIRPFDLGNPPLIRAGLIKLKTGKTSPSYILTIDTHHIVMDAVSLNVLARELAGLYAGKVYGNTEIQYKDYAVWQKAMRASDILKQQEAYWRGVFKEPIPILNLPLDFPRPATKANEGKTIVFHLNKKLTRDLNTLASQNGCAFYPVLLAAYYILLAKYTKQKDIIVGMAVAGRNRAEFADTIGVFINTLALRNYPEVEKTYLVFLQEVKENVFKAFDNQDYPFDELVERLNLPRDLSRNPLFDTMFDFIERPLLEIEGLEIAPYYIEEQASFLDLVLEAGEQDGKIEFRLQYDPQLFQQTTMDKLAHDYVNIIIAFVKNPAVKIKDLV